MDDYALEKISDIIATDEETIINTFPGINTEGILQDGFRADGIYDDSVLAPATSGKKLVPFNIASVYAELASQKLDDEIESFKGNFKEEAIYRHVAETLRAFCEEDERFAEVVYKTKRTLSDCCRFILKDVGEACSDIHVYREATKFYFPAAEVKFIMEVSIDGPMPDNGYLMKEAEKTETKTPAYTGKSSKGKTTSKKTSADAKNAPIVPIPVPKPVEQGPIQLTLWGNT